MQLGLTSARSLSYASTVPVTLLVAITGIQMSSKFSASLIATIPTNFITTRVCWPSFWVKKSLSNKSKAGIGTYDINESSIHKTKLGEVKSKVSKAIDKGFGTTFDAHVIAGYRFLMRYYEDVSSVWSLIKLLSLTQEAFRMPKFISSASAVVLTLPNIWRV